jgi:hypothetical protein
MLMVYCLLSPEIVLLYFTQIKCVDCYDFWGYMNVKSCPCKIVRSVFCQLNARTLCVFSVILLAPGFSSSENFLNLIFRST